MKTPLISVIVPVYEAETYIDECIQSILQQTQKELEIILVDDGSTDASGSICDSYAERFQAVTVIHKENAGLTAAWKSGLCAAQGKYVGFVDSDDWIAPDMYERMYEEAVQTDADIVCCGIRHVFLNHSHKDWEDQMQFPKEVYTREQMQQEVYPCFINDGSFMGRGLQPNRVSKLVRRQIAVDNIAFCDDRVTVGEDYQFSLAMFLKADKIAILKDYYPYFYRINEDSMTGQYDMAYMDKIKLMKEQLGRISREGTTYDFTTQIWNDFLCLTILHIKGGIVAHRKLGYRVARTSIKNVCCDSEVREALRQYHMPKLTLAEKVFLFFVKHHMYWCMYFAVSIYFSEGKN